MVLAFLAPAGLLPVPAGLLPVPAVFAVPAESAAAAVRVSLVPATLAKPGTELTIDCRGKDATATVVSGKFYKRPQ